VAEKLDKPHQLGKVHYELGRHLSPRQKNRETMEREVHLNRACEIFTVPDTGYDLAQEERALRQKTATEL
jgi:hypothetical protein